MKKLMLSALLAGFLAACAGQEVKEEKAAVEDKSPAAKDVQTAAVREQAVAANPLKDPSNILSRRSVYFDFDSSAVKDEYKPLVEAHAKYLSGHAEASVTLQGNCDERGSREYNLALGQRRAENVKKMMVVLGASGRQIETVSFGEEKPKAPGHDEASWQENRRADIVHQGE